MENCSPPTSALIDALVNVTMKRVMQGQADYPYVNCVYEFIADATTDIFVEDYFRPRIVVTTRVYPNRPQIRARFT